MIRAIPHSMKPIIYFRCIHKSFVAIRSPAASSLAQPQLAWDPHWLNIWLLSRKARLTWQDWTHHIVSCAEKISWSHGKIDQTIDSCFQPWKYLQLTWDSSDRNLLEVEAEPYQLWAAESFSKLYRWCPSTRMKNETACACDSSY